MQNSIQHTGFHSVFRRCKRFFYDLFYKAGYDIITDLCSITDNLIIFCIQIIQTGINNILEMFFQKFQKLFITTTQNGNAVNIIAGN